MPRLMRRNPILTAIAPAAIAALLVTAPPALAASRAEIARVALSQRGVHEGKHNCSRYGPCADWCAMFATWVWRHGGVPGVPRAIQRARGLGQWGMDRGLFKARAPGADGDPEVGDWVIWGSPSERGAGHVDLVTRVGNGTIDVIGGNVSDAVTLRTIDPATKTIARDGQRLGISGYVTPPGLGGTPPDQPVGTTPGSFDGVVAVTRGENQLDVFVRGGDFALMQRHFDGRAWGPWVFLGGKLDSEPAAVVTDNGRRIDVVARGVNGALVLMTWTAEGGRSGWHDTGGGRIMSSPSLTSRAPGTLDAFALTGDNVVSQRHMSADGHWGPWVSLGRSASSGPAAIASNGPARLNVLARDLDGSLLSRMWTRDHGWYSWVDRGGSIVGRPTVTTRTPAGYALDVFTRAQPTLALQHWYSRDGATFMQPVSLGGVLFATPSATSWGPGRLDVFSRNNLNQLVQRTWTVANAGWYPYVGLGATPAPPVTPPPAARENPPRPADASEPDAAPARGAVRRAGRWTPTSSYETLTNLDGRSTPRLNDRTIVDHVRAGQWVRIECQTSGERAYGSTVWDRVGGLYVPDKFIRTYTDGFLPGAPRCKRTVGRSAKPPVKQVSPRSCADTREDEGVTLAVVQRRELFAYDKSMVPARDIWRRPDKLVPMGRLRIGGATCRRGGRWRVLSPLAIDYSSAGLDGNGNPTGDGDSEGLGIVAVGGRGPRSTREPYLDIAAVSCAKGWFWGILAGIAEELAPPLVDRFVGPVSSFALEKAIDAGLLLPSDKVKCRVLARYRVSVWASPTGRLRASAEAYEFHPIQTESIVGGTRTIAEVNQWTTEVS
jgi:hypothetical protein